MERNNNLTTNNNQQLANSHNNYVTLLKETKAQDNVSTMVSLVLTNKEPSIGMMVRNGAYDLVKVHVAEAIASYVSILHSSRSVSVESIVTMSEYFLENDDVKHLKTTELKTFFNLAFKKQKYGKLYGGFGYDTLLEWLNQFLDERMQSIINFREQQHTAYTYYEKQSRTRSEGDAFGIGEILNNNGEDSQDRTTNTTDTD